MKYTSIVFAALVAATQLSSTFAVGQLENIASADTGKGTAFDTEVDIDVSENDQVTNNLGTPQTKGIQSALDGSNILDYTITITSGSTSTAGGTVTVKSRIDGQDTITYKPKPGFDGDDTFKYTFMVTPTSGTKPGPFGSSANASNEVTVTVTVDPPAVTLSPAVGNTPVVKQTFEIPDRVSTGNAVKYTRGGLVETAALISAAPDTKVITSIIKPVVGDSGDFAANSSPEVVQQNFVDVFFNFYNFFRGGN
jgi:hypothetical protein